MGQRETVTPSPPRGRFLNSTSSWVKFCGELRDQGNDKSCTVLCNPGGKSCGPQGCFSGEEPAIGRRSCSGSGEGVKERMAACSGGRREEEVRGGASSASTPEKMWNPSLFGVFRDFGSVAVLVVIPTMLLVCCIVPALWVVFLPSSSSSTSVEMSVSEPSDRLERSAAEIRTAGFTLDSLPRAGPVPSGSGPRAVADQSPSLPSEVAGAPPLATTPSTSPSLSSSL